MFGRKFSDKLQQLFAGRYGVDECSRFLTFAALALLIVSWFVWRRVLYLLSLVLIALALYRAFSKKITPRMKERMLYLKAKRMVTAPFRQLASRWRDRKTHRYFRCAGCKTTVRVPRGKGKIAITCPKCHTKFIRKT